MSQLYCYNCGKPIKDGRIVWLELDGYHATWHRPGEVPEEHSQGGFEFGADCAKRVLCGQARPLGPAAPKGL